MLSAAIRILSRYFGLERHFRWQTLLACAVLVFVRPSEGAEHSHVSCVAPARLGFQTSIPADFPGMHSIPGVGVLIDADSRWVMSWPENGKLRMEVVSEVDTDVSKRVVDLPGFGPLIRNSKGWVTPRLVDGKPALAPAFAQDIGNVREVFELPGAGILLFTEKGLFVARGNNRAMQIDAIDQGIRPVRVVDHIPGIGIVIQSGKGTFLVEANNGKPQLLPIALPDSLIDAFTMEVGQLSDEGASLLRWREQYYWVRRTGGRVTVEPARIAAADSAILGSPMDRMRIPGAGMLIGRRATWFLASSHGATIEVERLDTANVGVIYTWNNLRETTQFIGAAGGLFHVRGLNGKIIFERAGNVDTGPVFQLYDVSGQGLLARAANGWFLVRSLNGAIEVQRIDRLNRGDEIRVIEAGAGVFVSFPGGLEVLSIPNGKVMVDRAEMTPMSVTFERLDLPGGGLLLRTAEGLFVAQVHNGKLRLSHVSAADVGDTRESAQLPDGTVLVRGRDEIFRISHTALEHARVEPADRRTLEGIQPNANRDTIFDFSVTHACSSALDALGLSVRLTDPDGKPRELSSDMVRVTPGVESAKVSVRALIDQPNEWKFQFVSTLGGVDRNIGEVQKIKVASPDWLERVTAWGAGLGVLLLALNIMLLFAARHSPWAWRVATDDKLSTAGLRVGTLVIRHARWAQLWILDLYFQKMKAALKEAPPRFLPLPLKGADGSFAASDVVAAPPWPNRRLWIVGNSGMGKTALFRHVTAMHFRDHPSSFEAFRQWGCIVVAFSARDYADGGDDKLEPDWVVKGIKGTLAQAGLTFEDEKTLLKILQSGTIAVAIDGLHEADRSNAVNAFVRDFAVAPMFVTSQEPGETTFACWRLPDDMREFTRELLRLHLNEADTDTVMARISASGLKDAIRSGYDLRLIVDLVRRDPVHAPLPTDRAGLYRAVVDAAWPAGTLDEVAEQQLRTAAAAWTMVSERKPHEDIRRMKPGDGLGDLLERLANAYEREGRPIRLVRRVGAAYEFVHDQMHAYLAARWFAQEGLSVETLVKMLEASTIWDHPMPARRTLWSFIVALLDDTRLCALREKIEDIEKWDSLRRDLKDEARRRGLA